MSIKIIDTLEPLGRFPAVNAKDVEVEAEGKRLDEVIEELKAGSGTGGTKNYNDLENQPKVNGVTLSGDKSTADLGINIPTKVSELQNDRGYIQNTDSRLTDARPASDVSQWAKQPSKPSYTASEVGALPSTTEIPERISQLQNDSGFANISDVNAVNERVANIKADQDALSARMDTFSQLEEGSTTGDAELIDGRIGADGKVYNNIGGAIRGQTIDLKNDLTQSSRKLEHIFDDSYVIGTNKFDKTLITIGKTLDRTIGADINKYNDTANGFYANQIWDVKKGDIIRVSAAWCWLVVYNDLNKVIATSNGKSSYTVVDENAAKLRVYATSQDALYIDDFMLTINEAMPTSYIAFSAVPKIDLVETQLSSTEFELQGKIDDFDSVIYVDKSINLFNKDAAILDKTPSTQSGKTMYDLVDTAGAFTSEIYNVSPGDKLIFSTAWVSVVFYDSSGTFISRSNANSICYTAPDGSKYARIYVTQRNEMYFYDLVFVINRNLPDKPTKFRGDSLKDMYDRIKDYVEKTSANVFDKNCIEYNKSYKKQTGVSSINSTQTSTTTFINTQLWSVYEGDVIRVNRAWGTYLYYDENGLFVKSVSTADKEFTVPSGVFYMRFHYSNQTDHMEDDFMMTINKPMPVEYVPYGYISVLDNINNRLTEIENSSSPYSDKAILILNFDQTIIENDNRISIMENYGWKPSFVGGINNKTTKELIAAGWDLTTYWATSNVPTVEQMSEESESALNACKLYVQTGLEEQEKYGFFNPTAWMCRQNKYGPTLGKALQHYGYKIARGGTGGAFSKKLNEDFTQTGYTGIYSNNLNDVKNIIDTAVLNKSVVSVFTHYVVDDISEDRGYDCLKSVYIELMDYIKSLEDQGKLVVMNYREFYASQYPNQSHENDYNRIIKRMNFIESNS